MDELFATATNGYTLNVFDLEMLMFYISIGDEKDIMFLIDQFAETYPDPSLAELGFIVVWDAIVSANKQ